MATNTLTARNHKITLRVAGVTIPGDWKTFSGGGLTSESTINRPGGMADREALPGVAERENITLEREYNWVRDDGLIGPGGLLDLQVELGADSEVVVQRLNPQKQAVGRPKVYRGTIVNAAEGDLDSESGDPATMTVECTAVN